MNLPVTKENQAQRIARKVRVLEDRARALIAMLRQKRQEVNGK